MCRRPLRGLAAAIALMVADLARADPCRGVDNLTRVTGGAECLVIQTYNDHPRNRTLVVFIHGDGAGGGPSDYLWRMADGHTGNGVTGIVLIRPGYHDSRNRRSTGKGYRNSGDGYRRHVVDSVADAVRRLRAHHQSRYVILVGHSGGAAISGVILGRHPGLAQAALLLSCPCDVGRWRALRQRRAWPKSLSPHRFVRKVPAGTRVIALTGSRDANTVPALGARLCGATGRARDRGRSSGW